MLLKNPAAVGFMVFFLLAQPPDPVAGQARPDSLSLQQPDSVFVVPVMLSNRQWFVNYIFWKDIPDSMSTFIHPPDTTNWHAPTSTTVQESLAVPSSSGIYLGSIDRTVKFRVLNSGRVGSSPTFKIRYEIVAEEHFNNEIEVDSTYVPNDPIPCPFFDERPNGQPLDLGLNIHLTDGLIDSNGVFVIGLEDFEGYHIWRGIEADGSDLIVIGEVSKQEAFVGEVLDSVYFSEIIDSLRSKGVYELDAPSAALGREIDITNIHPNGRLGPTQMAWFDVNAFNGFTYRYAVTTFDRGYNVLAHRQGLAKFDNCPVEQGEPYVCASELEAVPNIVSPQEDLQRIYAVPNPYRSGTSQFSSANYHNFPDNKMRFVNVPDECTLRIYTVAGDLVYETTHNSTLGNIEWDTRNMSGREVASGAYIYRLETRDGEGVYGRIIIIR